MFTKRAKNLAPVTTANLTSSYFETDSTQIDKDKAIANLAIIWGCVTYIAKRLMALPPVIIDKDGKVADVEPLWMKPGFSKLATENLIC